MAEEAGAALGPVLFIEHVAASRALAGAPGGLGELLAEAASGRRIMALAMEPKAMRIELTSDPIDAERAYQIGLVPGLYDDRAALEAAADEMAGRIMENSPLAVQFLKRIVKDGRDMTVDHHWKFAEMFAFMLQRTEDALEARRRSRRSANPNGR